ncbi:hypothetical protein RQP46_000621 [Phenoliferia psychrophenolica]
MSLGIIPSAVLPAIRASCHELRLSSNIQINDAEVDAFLLGLDQAAWEKDAGLNKHGIRLPLRFDTPEEELNIICVLSLLNFLSGYREPLHRLTTRGAWSTILSLVLSAHLSSSAASSPLSTRGMLAATPATLASLAQITTHTEKDHPTMGPVVKVGEKDLEAFEILELLSGVLNETVVYIFKKSLFLLNAISLRFSPSSPPSADVPPTEVSFPVPDVRDLPIFADNVIPTILVHFKLLDVSASTDPVLAAGLTPAPTSASSTPTPGVKLSAVSAARLRAAAIDVCAQIVSRAHELAKTDATKAWLGAMRETDLDGYLWSLAKVGDLRSVPRMVETGTVFY